MTKQHMYKSSRKIQTPPTRLSLTTLQQPHTLFLDPLRPYHIAYQKSTAQSQFKLKLKTPSLIQRLLTTHPKLMNSQSGNMEDQHFYRILIKHPTRLKEIQYP